MQRCHHCGSKIKKRSKFCPECGMVVIWEESPQPERTSSKGKIAIFVLSALLVIAITVAGFVIQKANLFGEFVIEGIASKPGLIPETSIPEANEILLAFSDDPTAISTASQSVVKLNCYNKSGELYATGSGFACFDDNVIVTNYHVIEGNVYSIEASTENGNSFKIPYVLAVDEGKDIAILGTADPHNLMVLQPANSDDLQKGEKVVAIGSPLGLLNSVSSGVFSGLVEENGIDVLQFTASISSGSSGGALFNNAGEVLGITFASYEAGQNLNLAIPIEEVENVYNSRTHTKMYIDAFYRTQTHTYDVAYVLENYQQLAYREEEFYIDGWVSVHSYIPQTPEYSWLVIFNSFEDIPHTSDADWQNFGGQITIDEQMHDEFKNIILYADTAQVWNSIETIHTGCYVRALGHIKSEYLEWGGVSMDISELVVVE